MNIEDATARRFISHYKDFLLSITDPQANRGKDVLQPLAEARARYAADRSLFAAWRQDNSERDADMLDAIEHIEIRRRIYLKDTRSYSVFLREDGTAAYAVLGLTDRLRTMSGHSGIALLAGIFPLAGQFVCDGLLENVVTLGPNYMADFRLRYQALRESGGFYTVPDVGAASAANGGGGFAAEAAPTAAARKKRKK